MGIEKTRIESALADDAGSQITQGGRENCREKTEPGGRNLAPAVEASDFQPVSLSACQIRKRPPFRGGLVTCFIALGSSVVLLTC